MEKTLQEEITHILEYTHTGNRMRCNQILSLVIKRLNGIEQPKFPSQRIGFNKAIQAAIKELEWKL